MAEKSDMNNQPSSSPKHEEKNTGNWWDSWISSAKTKSAEVYSMVKKDLDEIGTAVKSEASHVFETTSTVIGKTLKFDEPESPANVMKKSLSSFIGQVSTVLNPEPDDEDDTEVILSSGDTTMLSTYKKELEALQRVDATFIVPADSPEFDAWKCSLEATGAVVSLQSAVKRLNSSPILKSQYDRLVPDAVSHEEFWERYMFRVALLQDRMAATARKQTLKDTDPVLAHLPIQGIEPIQESPKRTMPIEDTIPEVEDKSECPDSVEDNVVVAWEDEDFAHDVELTEEQQILLLEEYEKEIASKQNKQITKQTHTKDLKNNNTRDKKVNTNKTVSNKQVARDKLNNKGKDKVEKKNKNGRSPKKAAKSDVCGNDIVEDYFGEQKDDASSNSDESWEKEFEVEDVDKKE